MIELLPHGGISDFIYHMDDIGKHKKGIRKTGSGRKKICTKNPKIVERGGRKEKQKKLIFMTSYHWEWQW